VGGAGDASAQSSACDQLKATLSARIEASGVRDYSLEAVPASVPTPANVRVIGTCDGGRTKVLYYRGAARPTTPPDAPVVARPAVAPASSKAEAGGRERVPTPLPASIPARAPEPLPAPAPAPVVQAAPPPAPQPAPEPAPAPALAPQAPEPVPAQAPTTSLVQQASAFAATHWAWLLALVLVPFTGWLWAWAAHRRAYDKAGLPRGPRL